jgi:hypothetical protein
VQPDDAAEDDYRQDAPPDPARAFAELKRLAGVLKVHDSRRLRASDSFGAFGG